MSLADRFRRNTVDPDNPPGRKPIPPLVAPDIEKKLRAAETAFAALDRELGEAALAAITDDAALTHYEDLKKRIGVAHEQVALLTKAHTAALAQDEDTIRRQHAQLRKTHMQSVKRNAEAVREHATKAFGELLPAFVRELQKAIAAGEKVLDVAGIAGLSIANEGTCMARGELLRMIRSELFRLTATQGQSDFPGASSPNVDYDWQPEAIPSATKQIEQAVTALLALTEK